MESRFQNDVTFCFCLFPFLQLQLQLQRLTTTSWGGVIMMGPSSALLCGRSQLFKCGDRWINQALLSSIQYTQPQQTQRLSQSQTQTRHTHSLCQLPKRPAYVTSRGLWGGRKVERTPLYDVITEKSLARTNIQTQDVKATVSLSKSPTAGDEI